MLTNLHTERPSADSPAPESRPVYVDRLPPCNAACPAGENIQGWLAEAQAGRYEAAWRILVRDNPMPAVHGRICYHPCEDDCNRQSVDGAVSIHAVERLIGDMAIDAGWTVQPQAPSGKRILIVGAGPSGLSAAWHLALRGHSVVIHDAGPVAGGMLHFGIPRYRLPRQILEAEIARIQSLGVQIVLDHKVDDLMAEKAAGAFDAVFLAVGAHIGKRHEIPARDAGPIYDALQFLRDAEFAGEAPKIGRRVAVYGGGNTAMDVARTARRLGADPVIVYRRTRAQMPAHDFEAEEALQEGVRIQWLRTIAAIDASTMTLEVMELGADGRPRPTGKFETLEADSLVLALGQDVDTSFVRRLPGIEVRQDGTVVVGADMQTGCPGVFAGGDMVPAERTATTAIGHGKKAARYIDAWLRGQTYVAAPKHDPIPASMLRLWYGAKAMPRQQPVLDIDLRRTTFTEVLAGLEAASARFEAQRCLSCGNCFECDGCYSACPERAIVKLGRGLGYRVDEEKCTGCGICVDQCPCGALVMVRADALEPAGSRRVPAASAVLRTASGSEARAWGAYHHRW